jgi:ribosomal protein L17
VVTQSNKQQQFRTLFLRDKIKANQEKAKRIKNKVEKFLEKQQVKRHEKV